MKTDTRTALRRELLAAVLLLAALAVVIWKAPRGMANTDETLYLSMPYRILQGDRFLLHEWNLSQLVSLLLAPILRVCVALRGTTEGLVLSFRRLYVLFHGLTTLYLYLRLRRVTWPGALAASLMYLLYAPMNIATLSYNTLGIGLMAIAFVSLALCGGRTWEALFCGLIYALGVLCNPYYFFLYPVYLAAVLYCLLRRREAPPCLRGRFALLLTAAGAAIAILAVCRVLLPLDLPRLRETLWEMFYGDTSWKPLGLLGILQSMFLSFGKNRLFRPTLVLSAAMTLCALFDRRRGAHAWLYLLIAALLSAAYGLWFRLYANVSLNFYMFPISILGFFAWLIPEERENRLFFFIYLPGFLCWFCSAAASDLGFINIASVSTLNMIAAAAMICLAAKTLWPQGRRGRASAACMLLALAVQLGLLCEGRIRWVYPMEPTAACTARIEHGSLRGLLVAPEDFARYEAAWAAAEPVRSAGEGFVSYLTDIPGQYLDDPKRSGTYSAWFPSNMAGDNLPRLRHYWALFPDRVPEWIAVGTENAEAAEQLLRGLGDCGYRQFGEGGGMVLLRLDESGEALP